MLEVRNQITKFFRSGTLQSFLIVVAVALGVAVVTAVVAYIGSSYRQQAILQSDLRFREITVVGRADDPELFAGGEPLPRRIGAVSLKPVILTAADLEEVRVAAPSVDYAYIRDSRGWMRELGGLTFSFELEAVTEEYMAAARVEVAEGNTLAPSDFREGRPVMLTTPENAAQVYITNDPIGKRVFEPVGENEVVGHTIIGLLPSSDDPRTVKAVVPFNPATVRPWYRIRPDQVFDLRFAVEDAADLDAARAEIETYARGRWGEGVVVSSQSLAEVRERTRVATLFTAVFASLGLLIAAFNILNLFLARVLRRQHELAIRRALGADRWTIRRSVLGEAAVLGLLGGMVGVAAGYGLTAAFNGYLAQATDGGWPSMELSLPLVLAAALLAPLLSLLFSFYPALVASNVSIRDALGES